MPHKTCEHGKRLSRCRDCGGGAYCEHKKEKHRCKDCGGASICEHKREKYSCKDCGGKGYCKHGIQKTFCKDCGGSQYCEHNKRKCFCKECGGVSLCEHNKRKDYCKECGGTQICEHGINKDNCKKCHGNKFCKHEKPKRRCKECGGQDLCKSEWCEVRGIPKYDGYCLSCCIQLCPDISISRNYKTKENEVTKQVTLSFPNFTWVSDKKIKNGCSLRRPDLLLDMGSHIIIVEVDENKHNDYDCSCENKRLMEISMDLSHRPIIFIRFNPDGYIDLDGNAVKSCWRLNKLGLMNIIKSKQSEWDNRIHILKEQIQYFIDNPTEKTIEIIELFY